MSNNISWTSGGTEGILGKSTIVLAPKVLDQSSTTLSLTGKGVFNYGTYQQQNYLALLEHFASAHAPSNPTIGQLWYRPAEYTLYMCVDGSLLPSTTPRFSVPPVRDVAPFQTAPFRTWIKVNSSSSSDVGAALGYDPLQSVANSPLDTSGVITITGTINPQITIAKATSTHNGYLSAVDWNTFNNKLDNNSSAILATLGFTPVNKAGDTMTGPLVLNANPVASLGAATKQYVDTKSANATTTVTTSEADTSWYNMMATTQTTGSVAQALVSTRFAYQPSSGYIRSPNITTTNIITTNVNAARVFLANGSVAAPSLTFTSDGGQDTGLYWPGDGYIGFATNGVYAGQIQPGGSLNMPGNITANSLNIVNGAFSNNVQVPTQGSGDSSGNAASTAFVHSVVSSAPSAPAISGTFGALGNWVGINGQIPAGGIWVYYQMDIADDGNVVDARGAGGIAGGGTVLNFNGAGGGQGGHYGFAWRIA